MFTSSKQSNKIFRCIYFRTPECFFELLHYQKAVCKHCKKYLQLEIILKHYNINIDEFMNDLICKDNTNNNELIFEILIKS